MEMSLPHGFELALSATVSYDDLQIVAEVVTMRLPLRGPEQERVTRVRALLAAETELGRAFSAHTQHALINCQGSHGAANLGDDTAPLFQALMTYAALLHELAADYRGLVRDTEPRHQTSRHFESAPPLQLS
jgi:hypothetical protein